MHIADDMESLFVEILVALLFDAMWRNSQAHHIQLVW